MSKMTRMSRKQKKKNTSKYILLIFALVILIIAAIIILSLDRVYPAIRVEAGTNFPNITMFLKHKFAKASFVEAVDEIDMDVPGVHDVMIWAGNKIYTSRLKIVDTTPPKASVAEKQALSGVEIPASDYIDLAYDITEIEIYYKNNPDFNKPGKQEVVIVLEDTSGNKSEYITTLDVIPDTQPPAIQGVLDQTVYVGATISYRKNVIVVDDRDENVELNIDSSSVNLRQEGVYEVVYSAVDSSGNEAVKTAQITVMEKPASLLAEERLNELTDQVLEAIIEEDMTDLDKLWEIYKWVRTHINFTGDSDKTDWVGEATRGIQRATGDCFTYYATSHALLTKVGFDNIRINRARDNSFHAWNLVKYNGEWYHFDATPTNRNYMYTCFLRTDAEVDEYSQWRTDYYYFDKSKYPSSGMEEIKHERHLYN